MNFDTTFHFELSIKINFPFPFPQLKLKIAQTENKELATELEIKIRDRTHAMIHVYHTVAVHFADLHDTPERALEKGCINEIVPWRESRSWLYWRLRRLILENQLVKEILRAQSNLLVEEGRAMLYRWFLEEKGATEVSVIHNAAEL